jgi:hypothetical protein
MRQLSVAGQYKTKITTVQQLAASQKGQEAGGWGTKQQQQQQQQKQQKENNNSSNNNKAIKGKMRRERRRSRSGTRSDTCHVTPLNVIYLMVSLSCHWQDEPCRYLNMQPC